MVAILKIAMTLLLMGISSVALSADVSKSEVRAFLATIDASIQKLDTHGIEQAISDDATIELNIKLKGQNQVARLSKSEYLTVLNNGWKTYTAYSYKRNDVEIALNGPTAHVKADVTESITIKGKQIDAKSKEEATIELINGHLFITNIVVHTDI